MLKLLTEQEELELRREAFKQLRKGSLFVAGYPQKHYIVVSKKKRELEVIVLDRVMLNRIVTGEECDDRSIRNVGFTDLSCLNVLKR